jgi:hypothetical protein
MKSITTEQRRFADEQIDLAKKALRDLAENGRNLDLKTRDEINAARDSLSRAEFYLANQPNE